MDTSVTAGRSVAVFFPTVDSDKKLVYYKSDNFHVALIPQAVVAEKT